VFKTLQIVELLTFFSKKNPKKVDQSQEEGGNPKTANSCIKPPISPEKMLSFISPTVEPLDLDPMFS
jgi:hypothetical protein